MEALRTGQGADGALWGEGVHRAEGACWNTPRPQDPFDSRGSRALAPLQAHRSHPSHTGSPEPPSRATHRLVPRFPPHTPRPRLIPSSQVGSCRNSGRPGRHPRCGRGRCWGRGCWPRPGDRTPRSCRAEQPRWARASPLPTPTRLAGPPQALGEAGLTSGLGESHPAPCWALQASESKGFREMTGTPRTARSPPLHLSRCASRGRGLRSPPRGAVSLP